MLKVEFHSHTAEDPIDRIPYTTLELVDRASALGYDALAVTLHDRQLDVARYEAYAAERGIVLIPGIERTIQGKHVLLLNFSSATEDVQSFEDLAHLKRLESGLIIAPHPFFPSTTCLGGRLLARYRGLFDAVEWNGMFTKMVNFNRPAEGWARLHGLPMVGGGDVHRLSQLGTTWSLVDAPATPAAICAAVIAGRVSVSATPHSLLTAGRLAASLFAPAIDPWVAPKQPAQAGI
jgi:predicted metal-dependent phosphoesterase TrpH